MGAWSLEESHSMTATNYYAPEFDTRARLVDPINAVPY